MVVCGTRPEIIKMAPVYKALQASETLAPVLLHTGQHTDLAKPLYEFFDMTPDYTLELVREKPTLAHLSEILLSKTADIIEAGEPDAVLVHGDTSSAAMASLAAFYNQTPIGHVEAGLRTYDKYSPFPEEMNRSLIGRMADWHYAPTPVAAQKLRLEAVPDNKILMTGNTVIDAALLTADTVAKNVPAFVQEAGLDKAIKGKRLVLVTAHRRENWGEGLQNIAHAVADLLASHDDLLVVWPLHANPAVAKAVRDVIETREVNTHRLVLTAPLDYQPLIWLLQNAYMTLTDSGGIQEEAAALGTPVLILRDTTERPELIAAGGGLLVGSHREVIVDTFNRLVEKPENLARMGSIKNPFGDGNAAKIIVKHLESALA